MEEFLNKHSELNSTQRSLATAMLLGGATEEVVLSKVLGYNMVKESDNSLSCPRCNSSMVIVSLVDERKAKYCPVDRVCLPFRRKGV